MNTKLTIRQPGKVNDSMSMELRPTRPRELVLSSLPGHFPSTGFFIESVPVLISRVALIPKLEALVRITKSLSPERLQAAIRHSLSLAKNWTPRKLVWEFARYIAAIARDCHISRANAKRFFRVWHLEARKTGRDMPGFRECWLDFWGCLPKVKYPAGSCLRKYYQKATGEGIQRFKSMCRVMSKYFGGAFPVSSYAIAEVFQVSRKTIDRWRNQLVQEGVLKLESRGSFPKAQCAEFSYLEPHVLQAVIPIADEVAERSNGDHSPAEKAVLEGDLVGWLERLEEITLRRRLEMGLNPE